MSAMLRTVTSDHMRRCIVQRGLSSCSVGVSDTDEHQGFIGAQADLASGAKFAYALKAGIHQLDLAGAS